MCDLTTLCDTKLCILCRGVVISNAKWFIMQDGYRVGIRADFCWWKWSRRWWKQQRWEFLTRQWISSWNRWQRRGGRRLWTVRKRWWRRRGRKQRLENETGGVLRSWNQGRVQCQHILRQRERQSSSNQYLGINIVRQLIQALQCEGHNITTDNFSLADPIAGEAKESDFGWYYSY